MSVDPRSDIRVLPAYKPGRSPADLARELGMADAIKLASNENPFGPLPSVIEAITRAAAEINRYPDNGAVELTAALGAKYGVKAEQIALGCGSVTVCQQIVQAYAGQGDAVLFAWRSFEAYPLVVAVSAAQSIMVPLREDTHDLPAMLAAITDNTKIVFVCNPNNPTGTAVRRAELTAFLDAVPPSVLVILDEAYREYVLDADVPDGLELMAGRPNVAVLRTFSKAYGLAGLRVGYLIAEDPAVAETVRKTGMPFSVSSIAQAAAVASLEASAELAARVAQTVAERHRVQAELVRLGYAVPESHANFVWLAVGEQTPVVATSLEQRGLIVRPFGLEGVRITIGSPQENDMMLRVLRG